MTEGGVYEHISSGLNHYSSRFYITTNSGVIFTPKIDRFCWVSILFFGELKIPVLGSY
jgi:hypothetical protein